jgi:hypothetical protein
MTNSLHLICCFRRLLACHTVAQTVKCLQDYKEDFEQARPGFGKTMLLVGVICRETFWQDPFEVRVIYDW